MRIGVPSEVKIHEYRVGLMPASVRELVNGGHSVVVQSGAGNGVGCSDADYSDAGAKILPDAAAVFKACDMIVKVKEPQAAECAMLRPGQLLFTYLHLAADRAQAVRHLDRVRAGDTAADHDHACGRHAGHAAEQHAAATLGLLQVPGTDLHRHAAGHFAHRHQQRQRAVGRGHGLVGNRHAP